MKRTCTVVALLALSCASCAAERRVKPAQARSGLVEVEGVRRPRVTFTLSEDDGRGLKVVREYQILRSSRRDSGFSPFAHGPIVVVKKPGRGKKAEPVETRRRTVDDLSALPGRTYYYQVWALAEREQGTSSQAGAYSDRLVTGAVGVPDDASSAPEPPRGVRDAVARPPDEDDGRHLQISFGTSPDDAGGRNVSLDGYVVLRAKSRGGEYIPFVDNSAPPGAPEAPIDPVASEARARYLADLLGDNAAIAAVDEPALRELVKARRVRQVRPGDRQDPAAATLQDIVLEQIAGSTPPDATAARKRKVTDNVAGAGPFFYRVYTVPARGEAVAVQIARPAAPRTSWFSSAKLNMAVLLGAAFLLTLVFVQRAQTRGHEMFIRRIAGIDALEEAVGRATEMGRPILYVPGIDEIQNIQTIASLLILGRVAELVARYDSQIRVPCCIPIVATVAEEVVRQGYYNAGRPDQHRPSNIQWISSEQFAFCAGTNGIMLRDKPATNIFLGRFFGESLILAETGYVNKAIQIGGTAEITQLPFFIAACDYAIIGEELFAISAYMTREPKLLGSLKAADWIKAGVLGVIVVTALGGLIAWSAAPLSGVTASIAAWALRLVGFLAPGT